MFSEKLIEGLKTGYYPCPVCGKPMIFEDEKWRDVLVCTNHECGFSCELDDYGKSEEEIGMDYPTEDEVRELLGEGNSENDSRCSEIYEEVYNELDK